VTAFAVAPGGPLTGRLSVPGDKSISHRVLMLAALADGALWFAVALPGLTVAHSLFQGFLVHIGQTRGVTESVALFLVVFCAVLYVGVVAERWNGLVVAMSAFTAGSAVQAFWLWFRVRRLRAAGVFG